MSDHTTQRTDADFILAWLNGDRDALKRLITRYQPRLYRFIDNRVRNPTDAEDVEQQTWIQVSEKLPTLRNPACFRAWLFQIANRLSINHISRSGRPGCETPLDWIGEVPSSDLPPDAQAENKESVDHIHAVIREFFGTYCETYRTAIELVLDHGCTNDELAEYFGISYEAAAQLKYRALRALREFLATRIQHPIVTRWWNEQYPEVSDPAL